MKAIRSILLLLAAVAVCLTAVPNGAQAAVPIDLTRPCNLTLVTADFPSAFTGPVGDISGKLYRIADMTASGTFRLLPDYSGISLPNNIIGENHADVWLASAEAAASCVTDRKLPSDRDLTLQWREDSILSGNTESLSAGVYLVILEDGDSHLFTCRFQPFLVVLPGNLLRQTGTGPDIWQYDVEAILKPEWKRKTGNLLIRKKMERFCTLSEDASFVFLVEGRESSGELVYSNVVSIRLNKAGTEETLLTGLPAGLLISVREIYSGNAYTLVSQEEIQTEIIPDDTEKEPAIAEFVNRWNGGLTPGTAAVNRFYPAEDRSHWEWEPLEDNNLQD